MDERRRRHRIREVRDGNDPALRTAYRLFQRVFERAEMVAFREWANSIRERNAGLWTDLNWHVFVAEDAGRVTGAASGTYVGNLNVGIIGYVAVRPGLRSRGLGPRLRLRLRDAFVGDAQRLRHRPLAALVGEVRLDNPWLRHLVRREEAIALDFPYVQPALRGQPPLPLVLYYQPLLRPRRTLGTAELRRLLYTMWRRSYRIARPLSRPEFRAMLRAIASRRQIGQRVLPPPAARGRTVA